MDAAPGLLGERLGRAMSLVSPHATHFSFFSSLPWYEHLAQDGLQVWKKNNGSVLAGTFLVVGEWRVANLPGQIYQPHGTESSSDLALLLQASWFSKPRDCLAASPLGPPHPTLSAPYSGISTQRFGELFCVKTNAFTLLHKMTTISRFHK